VTVIAARLQKLRPPIVLNLPLGRGRVSGHILAIRGSHGRAGRELVVLGGMTFPPEWPRPTGGRAPRTGFPDIWSAIAF
jgi:hypothetical protein